MIRVTMNCGHIMDWSDQATGVPLCQPCQERRVRHVVAPMPRFNGACLGPLARPGPSEPFTGSVAPHGPLTFKE